MLAITPAYMHLQLLLETDAHWQRMQLEVSALFLRRVRPSCADRVNAGTMMTCQACLRKIWSLFERPRVVVPCRQHSMHIDELQITCRLLPK